MRIRHKNYFLSWGQINKFLRSLYACSQWRQTYYFWCFLVDQITFLLQLVTQTSTKWFVITTQPYRWQTLMSVCQYRRKDITSMLSFDVNYFCLMGLTWERYRRHWRVRILRVTSGNLTWFCTIRIFTVSVLPGSGEGQVCMQWNDLINGDRMQGRLKGIHYAKVMRFKGTHNKPGPSLV